MLPGRNFLPPRYTSPLPYAGHHIFLAQRAQKIPERIETFLGLINIDLMPWAFDNGNP